MGLRSSSLNQVSGRVCDDGFAAPHPPVKIGELVAVLLDGEIWYPPDTLAKDPHHGAHVIELHAAPGDAQIGDDQAGALRCSVFTLRVSLLA